MTIADGEGPFFPIEDQASAKEAGAMVVEAAKRLRLLGPQPINITSHRDKFNDASNDDYWRAVRVGHSHWEASYFFEGTDQFGEEVSPWWPGIEERTWTRNDPFGDDEQEMGALAQSKLMKSARKILNEIEGEKWQKVLRAACSGPFEWLGQGIYVDYDTQFLIIGNYSGLGLRDFWLATEDGLFHAFSDNHCFLGTTVEVKVDEAFCLNLPTAACSFLKPTVRDEIAHRELSQLISKSEVEFRKLKLQRAQYVTEMKSWYNIRRAKLSLDVKEIDMSSYRGTRNTAGMDYAKLVESFAQFNHVARSDGDNSFNDSQETWLKLLGRAYGMSIRDEDRFAIILNHKATKLVRFQHKKNQPYFPNAVVFEFKNGKLGDGIPVGDIEGGVASL